MKTKLLIFILLLSGKTFAQRPGVDSLVTALNNARHDTIRLKILDQLTQAIGDFKVWEPYNAQMKAISSSNIDHSKGRLRRIYLKFFAMSLNNEAYIHECRGEGKKALELYQRGLKISRSINEKANISTTLNNIGFVYKQSGEISLALDYYQQSLVLRKELNDIEGTATSYNNIAVIFHSQGDLPRALEYYQKSLRLREKIGDKKGMASALNGIGGIYSSQSDLTEAKKYFEKALAIKQECGDKAGEVTVLGNLAILVKQNKDTVGALRYFQRALKIARDNGITNSTANCLNNLGYIYKEMGELSIAMEYYRKSLDIRREINDKQGLATSLDNIGNLYLLQNREQEAIACFLEGLKLSREVGFVSNIERLSQSLYTVYKKQGKSAQALEMHELYMQMVDSMNNDNSRKAVIKSQFKFEYERKAAADSLKIVQEKKLSDARAEQDRASERTKRYALIAGIVVLLIIAFFAFQRFRLKQKLKELRIRNKIASDLHDEVGSALSSISLLSGMARTQPGDQHKTIRKIEETSRETLENMGDIVWSIQPRNDRLSAVVNRMKHYGRQLFSSLGIQFEFIREGEEADFPLNMEQRKSLYLVYKEALNNAAKYSGATLITVTISGQAKKVILVIADNGKGFDTTQPQNGNGLYTMRERALVLDGTFNIQSSPGKGTTVTLEFKTT